MFLTQNIFKELMEYAIQITDLKKTYQGKAKSSPKDALKNINLQIKKGSFFGLLGPNGAGKSTIINILAGLVNKTSGKVMISGIDVDNDQQATKYKIGVVPQELIIDPFFNVFETLEIYAGYYGIAKKNRRTLEIVEALGLKDKLYATPRSLSGGMRRRLLVAKALVHDPEILILDEPTAGVDVELRNQLWDYVKKLNNEGTTILLTTHYLEEAEKLCNQIAIINKGEVIVNDEKENLMKSLSRKELIITSKNEFKITQEIFGNDLVVKNLSTNKISITYDPNKTEINNIVQSLFQQKIHVVDIVTQQPDLEEIFKHLIAKK